MALNVIILAAGEGKRMHSPLPKVLHSLAGRSLLEHVIQAVLPLQANIHVVYRSKTEAIEEIFHRFSVNGVTQSEPLGTGHAVQQVLPFLSDHDRVLILCGDTPLITTQTLQKFVSTIPEDNIGCLTTIVKYPYGLGRIIRDRNDQIIEIIEEKDAAPEQKKIHEINAGIYLMPVKYLKKWLPTLQNNNAQKEFYLTDVIKLAIQNKIAVRSMQSKSIMEIQGVNDKEQLAKLERHWQKENARKYMLQGLVLLDFNRFDVRGELIFGKDVVMDVNVIIEGVVQLGDHCKIGPNVILKNVKLGNHVEIKANTVIEDAIIEDDCVIGPFARIRPETQLAKNVKIGNFVEVKKSHIGESSKVNHLTYIGDTIIGQQVNVGAGTITCNYDGANKHKTIIEDYAFIGSNVALVAPVTIEAGATIGAGSTINQTAPKNKLTLARAKQVTVDNWVRPRKKEKVTRSNARHPGMDVGTGRDLSLQEFRHDERNN